MYKLKCVYLVLYSMFHIKSERQEILDFSTGTYSFMYVASKIKTIDMFLYFTYYDL